MKLLNNSREFTVQFSGVEHIIPTGEFEIVDVALAHHVVFTAQKWGKDVQITDDVQPRVVKPKKVESIKKIESKVSTPKASVAEASSKVEVKK